MRYYNLSLADVVQRLKTMTPDGQALVKGSIAVTPHLTEKREDLILAHFIPHNEQRFVRDELAYDDLRLVKESISVEDLCDRITHAANSGSFELFDGLKVEVIDQASMELLPSEALSTRGARYYLQLYAKKRGGLRHSDPLIKYGHLSFESAEQAVRAWVPLRPFHGNSDGRIGCILIELPLLGPRLGALTVCDGGLVNIEVERIPREMPIQLTGVWQSNDASFIEPFMKEVTECTVQLSRPSQADQIALWLTMPGTVVADFFFENPFRCSRDKRVLYPPDAERVGNGSDLLAQIQSGEGENLELKPFLKPEADKFNELIKTLIAFANKRGGMICMGVSNHLEIEGVERDLRDFLPKNEKVSLDECAARYCAVVKAKVNDRVSGKIELLIDTIRVCDKLLIRLVVKEGKHKPYSDLQTKEIWTRRGANTVRPDPVSDELKQLVTDVPHPFGS